MTGSSKDKLGSIRVVPDLVETLSTEVVSIPTPMVDLNVIGRTIETGRWRPSPVGLRGMGQGPYPPSPKPPSVFHLKEKLTWPIHGSRFSQMGPLVAPRNLIL
jgi:hypothetical protein